MAPAAPLTGLDQCGGIGETVRNGEAGVARAAGGERLAA